MSIFEGRVSRAWSQLYLFVPKRGDHRQKLKYRKFQLNMRKNFVVD